MASFFFFFSQHDWCRDRLFGVVLNTITEPLRYLSVNPRYDVRAHAGCAQHNLPQCKEASRLGSHKCCQTDQSLLCCWLQTLVCPGHDDGRDFEELSAKYFFSVTESINFQFTLHLPVKVMGLFLSKYFSLVVNLYQQ